MSVPRDPSRSTTEVERRRAPRHATLHTMCQLFAPEGDPLGSGLVWNISRTGVSILVGVALAAGSSVEVELIGAGGRVRLRVGLRVIHRTEIQTGDFIVGGQFGRSLEDQELLPFLA